MACFHPLSAWQLESGEIVFAERGKILRSLTLPCGQCIGCRLERSRQWAVRCMHESQMHTDNCFVTLTYSDENLPSDMSLHYKDYQLFMRRLRKTVGSCRFYMCGEYGETYGRPHYHACLFGLRPSDLYAWRKSAGGFQLYRSPALEDKWGLGHVEVGDVTFESAAYCARYIMKKVTGSRAEDHYKVVDPETGELFDRTPEFTRMSLKPGIGFPWYEKYKREVFPRDRVVVRGVECKPPRYYALLLEEADNYMSDDVYLSRHEKFLKMDPNELSEARLLVKEDVCKAKLKHLKRSIE